MLEILHRVGISDCKPIKTFISPSIKAIVGDKTVFEYDTRYHSLALALFTTLLSLMWILALP